jgi:dTDP-4-dehydrorhamnose reductase
MSSTGVLSDPSSQAKPIMMLTGGSGFLGRRLSSGLANAWHVVNATRTATAPSEILADLLQPASLVRAFNKIRPTAVVHAAGLADPDACERDPGLAHRVNVQGVETLAKICAEAKTCLVHFSTDLVFDGKRGRYREEDAPAPLSVYGRSKLQSEQTVLRLCPNAVVLRVSNCYGRPLGGRACFVDKLQAKLAAGHLVRAFTDQWRTSTAGDQLPHVVARLLTETKLRGLFHWGGGDRTTRYEAALTFCRVMGYDERLVQRLSARRVSFLAERPRDTSLDSSRLASALGLQPVGLQAGFSALKNAWAKK